MRSQSCYREYSFHSVAFCCIEINKDPFEEGVVLTCSKNGVIMYFHSNAIQLGRAIHAKMQRLSDLVALTLRCEQ